VHNQQKVVPSNAMQKKMQNLHRRLDFVEYGFFTIMIHNWEKNPTSGDVVTNTQLSCIVDI
jgi:hypothetical protein